MCAFAQPTFFSSRKAVAATCTLILATGRGHQGLVIGKILGGCIRDFEGKIFL